jgi:hypothetical protein
MGVVVLNTTPLSTIQLFESAADPSLDEMELFALEGMVRLPITEMGTCEIIPADCDGGESRFDVR